jgi:hypothetical protein
MSLTFDEREKIRASGKPQGCVQLQNVKCMAFARYTLLREDKSTNNNEIINRLIEKYPEFPELYRLYQFNTETFYSNKRKVIEESDNDSDINSDSDAEPMYKRKKTAKVVIDLTE